MNFITSLLLKIIVLSPLLLSARLNELKSNLLKGHFTCLSSERPENIDYCVEQAINNNIEKHKIIFDNLQSEEGGRFYKEQNRNMIVVAGDEVSEVLPENYIWMTLNQLNAFIKFNNYLNIQARSLLAAVSFM